MPDADAAPKENAAPVDTPPVARSTPDADDDAAVTMADLHDLHADLREQLARVERRVERGTRPAAPAVPTTTAPAAKPARRWLAPVIGVVVLVLLAVAGLVARARR